MRNGLSFVAAATFCACWLALSAVAPAAESAGPPAWIDHPKSDDSVCLYRVGHSQGLDRTGAQQAAYENALSVIVNEMLARAGVEESLRPEVAAGLPVRNAELVPGAVYTETNGAGCACWVQVSYPLTEKAKLLGQIEPEKKKALERVEAGRRLAARYVEAKAAHGRGDEESALTNLQAVIRDYPGRRTAGFDMEEARLLLGDVWGARKDFLEARRHYEEVLQGTASASWKEAAAAKLQGLPPPPRAWPLRDRWNGRKVALLCGVREAGQAPRPFPALAEVLGRDCREARLECVDLAGDLGSDGMAALFDRRSGEAAGAAAKKRGAGVVLAVLLTTDPAKRGKTQEMMGVAMPVADTEVSFLLLEAEGAAVRCGDRFAEVSGNRSETRLAERVGAILVEKHLVPKCPALKAAR